MNKVLKRLVVLCTAGSLMLTGLVGCGQKEEPKPDEMELAYQYWDLIPNQDEIFQKFTDQYKEETGITVTINGQFVTDASWQDTLKTQIAAGSGTDVFHMDLNNFSAWRDAVIQPLSPYYEDGFWDQFVSSSIDVWNAEEQYYAVPNSFSVVALLYNKDMFKEAGIDVNSSTKLTLEDFEGAMEKLYDTYKGKNVTYTDGKLS